MKGDVKRHFHSGRVGKGVFGIPPLWRLFADRVKTERTIIPGDEVHIDFTTGTITYRSEAFHFPPLHGAAVAGDCARS